MDPTIISQMIEAHRLNWKKFFNYRALCKFQAIILEVFISQKG